MSSLPPESAPQRIWPAWAVAEGPLGIRLLDAGIVGLVIAAVEVNVIVGNGPGAVPLNLTAYLLGALLAVPILFRHRWPFRVLLASAVLMLLYYIFARRDISPAPVLFVPLYDAAVAGYLAWAIAIPAGFMVSGLFVVEMSTRESLATLTSDFLSQIVILALAVMLGEVVRSRRALTAETASRLRLAEEERAAEAGRVVAEERLRIARELHDTVAHAMATITVQAGSALHLLGRGDSTIKPAERSSARGGSEGSSPRAVPSRGALGGSCPRANTVPNDPALGSPAPISGRVADADTLRAALTAIRETSKAALIDMRSVLGQLRRSDPRDPKDPDVPEGRGTVAEAGPATASPAAGTPLAGTAAGAGTGLARLPALRDAVTAAGAPVTVTVEGGQSPLSAEADHSAYRILQESLTNVLRHAGPGATARVCLRYQPGTLTITVTDDGATAEGSTTPDGNEVSGHGIRGMRERAASVGGELTAGPLAGGGFQVQATLPTAAPAAGDAPARRATSAPARTADNAPAADVPARTADNAPAADAPARRTAGAPAGNASDALARGAAGASAARGESS